jgi:UDPglucose 6-dehydrogenase
VHVCSNPEFLKEGAAVDDFMKPDRVVIGVDSEYARKVLASCTRRSCGPATRSCSWMPSAEITKYAANAMLATRISFMNMIARLCDAVGADVESGAPGHRLRRAHRQLVPLRRLPATAAAASRRT